MQALGMLYPDAAGGQGVWGHGAVAGNQTRMACNLLWLRGVLFAEERCQGR